jgi:hypothetical protein
MRKRKPIKRASRSAAADRSAVREFSAPESGQQVYGDDEVTYSSLSLHQLFESQVRQMLERTDLDEEQKQNVLVALSCPCCGAGGMSFTAKLKR